MTTPKKSARVRRPRRREVDEIKPCDSCGTTDPGLYAEWTEIHTGKPLEWLCEKCGKEKYPDAQRLQ